MSWLTLAWAAVRRLLGGKPPEQVATEVASDAAHKAAAEAAADALTRAKK